MVRLFAVCVVHSEHMPLIIPHFISWTEVQNVNPHIAELLAAIFRHLKLEFPAY